MTKIKKLEVWEVKMPLTEPYTIAYETIHETSNIFLRIETDNGIQAFGCAAPDLEVTKETPEAVLSLFKDIVEPYLHHKNPFQIAKIMDDLRKECPQSPSLMAMVDIALQEDLFFELKRDLEQFVG